MFSGILFKFRAQEKSCQTAGNHPPQRRRGSACDIAQESLRSVQAVTGFARLKGFFRSHREAAAYLFFGGLAFLLNVVLFALIDRVSGVSELLNNAVCWVVCVLFQFWTNRTWVFRAETRGAADFWRQAVSFVSGRVLTLLAEEAILAVFITGLGLCALAVKLSAQAAVIVLNYVISRAGVFRRR